MGWPKSTLHPQVRLGKGTMKARRCHVGRAKAATTLRFRNSARPTVPTTAPTVGTAERTRRSNFRRLGRFCPPLLPLAHRTEERRSCVLHDPLYHPAASLRDAGLALSVVDAEAVLEVAEFAVGLAVIAQRRAAGL